MLNTIIGREIKLIGINKKRYTIESGIKVPMLYQDGLIKKWQGHIFEIVDYNKEDKRTAIIIGGEKIWLYRDEYKILLRNIFYLED
jgi:hypothetical protein